MNATPIPRDQLMRQIADKFPRLFLKTSEEFDRSKRNAIWTSAEDGCAEDGRLLFSYYAEDFREITYVLGVHRVMLQILDAAGWYAEFYDPGTVMIYVK